MNRSSRLDNPDIRAVLEANRAKLAMMQAQQKAQEQAAASSGTIKPTAASGIGSIGLPKPPSGGEGMRSNPMFSEDQALGSYGPSALGPSAMSEDLYAPKLAGAIRTPPISGLSSNAGLPPVGDLFSHRPALPLGVVFAPDDFSTANNKSHERSGALLFATPPPHTQSSHYHSSNNNSSNSGSSNIPHFAAWDEARPFLSGSFLYDSATKETSSAQPLESYPPQVQESMLVDDLLYAFSGLEGTWIRPKLVDNRNGLHVEFCIVARGQLEPALLEMATRMLPLCECVSVILRFVETRRQFQWGLICQALAGAMRSVLHDWELMLAQLEHQLREGKLTLQALWYYVQPPMAALKLVASLAAEASSRRLRGASLLSLLHSKSISLMGDASAHKLSLRLLRAASEPYFSMLERWLCQGIVDDPYSEFLIVENVRVSRDDLSPDGGSAFWSERFTLRPAIDPFTGSSIGDAEFDVPVFLSKAQGAILDTGRCINLTKSCDQVVERTLQPGVNLEYDDSGKFLLHIQHAHQSAASAALSFMRHQVRLSRGLAAIKRYFLASQGDLFLGLMESGDADLNSLCGQVPLQQLQSVLDIAVRASSAASDPVAAHLKAAYDHRSVLNLLIAITQTSAGAVSNDSPAKRPKLRPVFPAPMTASEKSTVGRQRRARESFMLSYEVPWPLNIIVPDSAMAQYQMIFRHIFELKWVEKELNRVCGLYQLTAPLAVSQRRGMIYTTTSSNTNNPMYNNRRGSLNPGLATDATAALADSMGPSISSITLTRAYRTCQLMTHFFRQYLLYATFEVLEPLWAALESHIESANSIDEIIEYHRAFLKKVMKGLLLSRKVVVLRSLLNLKQLALEFVSLTSRYIDLDFENMVVSMEGPTVPASLSTMGESSAITGVHSQSSSSTSATAKNVARQREKRLAKQAAVNAALSEALESSEFSQSLNDLRNKFQVRCGDFMTALADAHKQARSERTDSREELEGLLNLMSRLDFNSYFAQHGVTGE